MNDFETIRPIISGLIGGIISIFLLRKFEKNVPKTFGGRQVEELVQENKTKIQISNILFFLSIAAGLLLYHNGYFERNDWRGLAFAFGFAMVSPAVFLFLSSIGKNSQFVKETFLAYAVAQRIPLWVLYAGFTLGAICLFAAVGA